MIAAAKSCSENEKEIITSGPQNVDSGAIQATVSINYFTIQSLITRLATELRETVNRSFLALLIATALGLAGCGGTDDATEPEPVQGWVDEFNEEGETPLIGAIREGTPSAIRSLLDAGANPNGADRTSRGWTVLMHAIHQGRDEVVDLLMERGADPNGISTKGKTALMMAAGYGHTAIVEALLDAGANPYTQSTDGTTALGMAVGGVLDIDGMSFGKCQLSTVRALKTAAPDLKLDEADRFSRLSAWWGGCDEVMAMVQ